MGKLPEFPTSVDDLIAQIEAVSWFSNVGRPTPADAGVGRIWRWEDWPGPDDLGVQVIGELAEGLHDLISAATGKPRTDLSELWDRIHAAVFRAAAHRIPYDPQQDCYHGPTTAVWAAAWTACLVGLYLHTGRFIPPDLREHWAWYARGHWPCAYSVVDDDLGPMLVY
ncbi:MAG: hypothetical protein K2X82_28650 [Gemmataceae bacterium]|nr:hypothetical protein [Gemmataceae bacterium]